ncbi:pyridoxal biosynthesis protein [Raphidocelis subcapitata]|uniref:glutaminase n=1 Tax=Raphidocelis subcapitata TaxID=307507 RepID=A0A2V0P1H8_9CHLO|nr:pyridoxal biosynthesis protein [Raphidocelis subcapitata]|eukprot:GBF93728.1 pyridoxal biosynthesis protein [Raphidocelis subcapitata]
MTARPAAAAEAAAAAPPPPTAAAPPPPPRRVRVGVLALQGSFREHAALLARVDGVEAVEVRTKEELAGLSGLIIPGGESTTMAHIAERWGLIPELQAWARQGRPIWGTCAGMIFLAERAEGQKQGGQALLGGLDVCVSRNFFGAQVHSFETQLPAPPGLRALGGPDTFRAVFIRAPAVLEAGPGVEVLAEYNLTPDEAARAEGRGSVAVAVRKGQLLATAFHPELTSDLRWHRLFVDMVRAEAAARQRQEEDAAAEAAAEAEAAEAEAKAAALARPATRPADLPIYGQEFLSRA